MQLKSLSLLFFVYLFLDKPRRDMALKERSNTIRKWKC